MKKFILGILLFGWLGAWPVFASEAVMIAVDQANPPFMYEKEGKAAGLYPTLVEAIFRHMKIPVTIKALPWKRALQEADLGHSGIAGIYKNTERLQKYDYSQEIFPEKLVLFVLKEKEFTFQKISDLHGKKIGVIRGWSYGDEFDAARKNGLLTAQETRGDEQNFNKLIKNRLDCVLAIEESGQSLTNQLAPGKIIQLNPPLAINPTYLIFPKISNQQELLSRFDAALKEMQSNGEYAALIKEFFSKSN